MIDNLVKNIDQLNQKYEKYSFMDRLEKLFAEFDHDKILISSSFGATSSILLHQVSKVAPDHPVYFINTGYLFEETVQYKNRIRDKFGLTNIVEVGPNQQKHDFTTKNETYRTNQDLCCFVNKVEPMQKLKEGKQIWVSGIFRHQNQNRAKLRIFEPKDDLLKFHPIIDMSKEDVQLYQDVYDLPKHGLIYQGYGSIGCTHCTAKGDDREGRWLNSGKTECGLHT
ncbi:MAG: phosphoadenylyl-sulfate reductase [Cyclobacteriaceae bacterium]